MASPDRGSQCMGWTKGVVSNALVAVILCDLMQRKIPQIFSPWCCTKRASYHVVAAASPAQYRCSGEQGFAVEDRDSGR